jgi:hypothetical protein
MVIATKEMAKQECCVKLQNPMETNIAIKKA